MIPFGKKFGKKLFRGLFQGLCLSNFSCFFGSSLLGRVMLTDPGAAEGSDHEVSHEVSITLMQARRLLMDYMDYMLGPSRLYARTTIPSDLDKARISTLLGPPLKKKGSAFKI